MPKRVSQQLIDELRRAIENDDPARVRAFVEAGGTVDQTVQEAAMPSLTMLAHACSCGSRQVGKYLIESGAKLDKGSCKPLVYAALAGQIEMVHLLLDAGADANVTVRDTDENVSGM